MPERSSRRRTPDVKHTVMFDGVPYKSGTYRTMAPLFDALCDYRRACISHGACDLPNVVLAVGEYFDDKGGVVLEQKANAPR